MVFMLEHLPALRAGHVRHFPAFVTKVAVQGALLAVELAAIARVLFRVGKQRRQVVVFNPVPDIFAVEQN